MKATVFKGACTAMYTPFDGNSINYESAERQIEFQIKNGISALLALGTTGEPCTVTDKERREFILFTVNKVHGRVPVIVGCGSNCTARALSMAEEAKELNADAVLSVTPYYNKCTQKGLIKHFAKICESDIPVILYNVPSRTCVNIEPDTLKELVAIKNVAGLKEASPDAEHIRRVAEICKGNIALYSGNDGNNVLFYSLGASGAISVASNIIPYEIGDIYNDYANKFIKNAENKQTKYESLYKALFIEVNPIPVKAMAELMGFDPGEPRLPLTVIEEEHKRKIIEILDSFKLI